MVQTQQNFPNIAAPIVNLKTGVLNQIWYQFFITLWTRTGQQQGSVVNAPGTISAFGGTDIPVGWLLCDGAAINRAAFNILFSVIGTTWGPGDNSTTFNIPDLQDRFLVGAGLVKPLGHTGGASSLSITTANLPAHSHTITDPGHIHSITDPGHFHTDGTNASDGTIGVDPVGCDVGVTGTSTTGVTVDPASTGITGTNNTGSGNPVSILPRFAAVNWMIKT